MKDRTILHCDMNSFFASVELLDHPALRDLPTAVCGDPKSRHGIILAKNEAAKKYGIRTAETLAQARRKCPQLHCLPPHHDKYRHWYHVINKIYNRYTDRVEPFSIDESWLDVSGSLKLFGSGREIADDIRRTVREETGLTLSAGVSFNKFLAKMGSEYKKPDATTVLTRDNFRQILWPLDIEEMFFVGRVSADKLRRHGLRTIGDLAGAAPDVLRTLLGSQGPELWNYANGRDDRPVLRRDEQQRAQSIGNGMTFPRDLSGEDDLRTAVVGLSDQICSRLRRSHLRAGGIKAEIKAPDFSVISRQRRLEYASATPSVLAAAALDLIRACWGSRPIRLLTLTAIYLVGEEEAEQISFFADDQRERQKGERIDHAVDDIRARFGSEAITFGRVLDNDLGIRGGGRRDHHDRDDSEEDDR
ncbi:MAG: DNA polymerase IV [Anaerovoracaceae bacterium]|jgi:DNA polymerase-4